MLIKITHSEETYSPILKLHFQTNDEVVFNLELTSSHYIYIRKQGSLKIVHLESHKAEIGDELILLPQLRTTA